MRRTFEWPQLDGKPMTLLPTQEKFLLSAAEERYFIGAIGAGKSIVLVQSAVYLSLAYPGNVGGICRKDAKDLEKSTFKWFWRVCPRWLIDWDKSTPSKDHYVFINGSEIYFSGLNNIEDFLSREYGWIAIDEVSETDEETIALLDGRIRHVLPRCTIHRDDCPPVPEDQVSQVCAGRYPPKALFGVMNPNGHDFIWKRAHPDSKTRVVGIDLFVPEPFENAKNLPKGYYEKLVAKNGADWTKRFVFSNFDVFESQVYKDWNEKIHVIPEFKEIPSEWKRIVTLDPASGNGFTAAAWAAIDPWGNFIFYRDYRQSNPNVRIHAEAIKALTGKERIDEWIADPTIRRVAGTKGPNEKPYSLWDEYAEWGLEFTSAQNDMDAGIARVTQYLKPRDDRSYPGWHKKSGQGGAPKLFVTASCSEIRHWLPQWSWKMNSEGMEELTTKRGKDTPDTVRYSVMSRELTEEKAPEVRKPTEEDMRRRQRQAMANLPYLIHAKIQQQSLDDMVRASEDAAAENYF